ncbi:MAG: phage holin family protein [Kofleriaceae bacterium]
MARPPDPPRDERGIIELVEAIIDDSRDLVEAHVEALREDMSERLSSLGATVASSLLAFSIMIVTALLLGIAVATTLIAIGLPVWVAFWIVTLACAGSGVGLVRRAQRKARETGQVASAAADRVKSDVAWFSDDAPHASLADGNTPNVGAEHDDAKQTTAR